jgi:mono/diheme cytochrome c family protein
MSFHYKESLGCAIRDRVPHWFTALILATALHAAPASTEAKMIFKKRCTACHTFGKGTKVGPDLKGVTDRRTRDWLLKFVRSSSAVIASGDATATKLFAEFKRERMPDWDDLSQEQVGAILDYFAEDGPEQKGPDERGAGTATAAEVEAGSELFHGVARFTYGGRACSTCHSVRDREHPSGGTLGPDLTTAYRTFRDRALADFLRRPCFERQPESSVPAYLTPQELFDLKVYLAKASGLDIPSPAQSVMPGQPVTGKSAEPDVTNKTHHEERASF